MISASAMFLRSSGRVIRHSFCHQVAPSTSAASYSSVGMPCMPAISSIIVSPDANQVTNTQMAVSARP